MTAEKGHAYLIEWETENGDTQSSHALEYALKNGVLTYAKADAGFRPLGTRTIRGVSWVDVRETHKLGK
jgi:hypothetical protein